MLLHGSLEYIEQLIDEIARESFNEEAIAELAFCLRTSEKVVPVQVASVLLEKPKLCIAENPFPGRVAYGVVDYALNYRDLDQREAIIRIYKRRINRIRTALLGMEGFFDFTQSSPLHIVDVYEDLLGKLRLTARATQELALVEILTKAELAALTECLIQIISLEQDLSAHLIKKLALRFKDKEKKQLIQRTKETIEEGFSSDPCKEGSLYCDLNKTCLQKQFHEDKLLRTTAEKLSGFLQEICYS